MNPQNTPSRLVHSFVKEKEKEANEELKEVEQIVKNKEDQHQNSQNNQIIVNTLKTISGEGEDGQKNPKSNVTTTKNVVTVNVGTQSFGLISHARINEVVHSHSSFVPAQVAV